MLQTNRLGDRIRRIVLLSLSMLFLVGINAYSQAEKRTYNSLLEEAHQGDSKAQALLAYYLKEGIDVEKNLAQAKEWARTATLYQNGLGYWLLAQIGQEMGESPSSYRNYLDKALACKYPLAFSYFGRLYEAGSSEFGIEQDDRRAFSYLQQAADEGDTEAAAYIAYRYLKCEKDPVNAFKYFRLAAAQGDAASIGMLASMYSYGVGTDSDPKAALEWYQKAADAGDALGFLGLAECYRLGLAASLNQQEAFKYYQKCSASSPRLQYILGYYHALGEGTKQDIPKALSLLRQSADAGYVYAQAFLGITQFEGVVPFKNEKDVSKAFNDLKSAYDNPDFGILPASVRRNIYRYLSGYYRFGRGVASDVAFADELMKKADVLPEKDPTPAPYAMVGKMSFEECLETFKQKPLSSPEQILKQVSFEYPVPDDTQSIQVDKEEKDRQIEGSKHEIESKSKQVQSSSIPSPSSTKKNRSRKASESTRKLELGLGLGTALYYGDNDWKVRSKREMFTIPAIDFYLTGWISPKFGIGIGVNGAPFKGLYQTAIESGRYPSANFRPGQITYYTDADNKYDAEKLAVQTGSYLDVSVLAHVDLMNIFGGNDTNRFFDIDAYAGGGLIFGFCDSGNIHDVTFNAGFMNTIRITRHLRFWLNFRGALTGDSFDGESYMGESTMTHWRTNQKNDMLFGATFGLSFNFGR